MPSMLEIATEAKIAAGRKLSAGLDRARRATMRAGEASSPDALARVIESDIIPRLLVAHTNIAARASVVSTISETENGSGDGTNSTAGIPRDYLERFTAATLTEEVGPLMSRIEALMLGGVDIETIYLHLLAPSARQLGTWWDNDQCDFVDVTMGLWRLQELVHALSSLVPGAVVAPADARTALFSPAPGEQHGLGAMIVEEFFRRAGWQTWSAPALDEHELVALAAGRCFDLIGLTVSVGRDLDSLARSIAAVRLQSRNPDLIILVGGRVFTEAPELAAKLGADGTAADGNLAVQLAERLLGDATERPADVGGQPRN